MNRTREQLVKQGCKATEDGVKAGEAGLHFEAANFYGTAVLAFMGARNETLAYEADGFRHYHLGTHAAQIGSHEKAVQHLDDAEILFQRSGNRDAPLFWSHICGGKAAHVRGLMALHALQYPEAAQYSDRTQTAFETVEALAAAGTPTSMVVNVNRLHSHALATYARAEHALSVGQCDKATSYFRESERDWAAVINVAGVPPPVTRDIQGWIYFVRGSANYTSALSSREARNNEAALEFLGNSRLDLDAAALASAASPASAELGDCVRKRRVWVGYAISRAPAALVRGTPNDEQPHTTTQSSAPSDPPVSAAPIRPALIANTQRPQSNGSPTSRPRDRTPAPSPRVSPTM